MEYGSMYDELLARPSYSCFHFFELIVPPTLDQALQYQYVSGKSLFLDVTM